jgi:Ca-activated chloride channel homolog
MKRLRLWWICGAYWGLAFFVSVSLAQPQQAQSPTPTPSQSPAPQNTPRKTPPHAVPPESRIKVETNLVSILTSVLDSNRRPVADLPKQAFQLYEEGVLQQIDRFEAETSQPLDLALMIDTSLSALKELKFEGEAAAHFIRQVVRPGDRLALFEFSENVTEVVEFSDDVTKLQDAARRLRPGIGTSMYDAVVFGSQELRRRPGERRRVIVLVTDAGETTSSSKFEDARRAAIGSEALLYSIIIRPVKSESGRNTAGEHALETITDNTGGALFYIDELGQLDATYDQIDRELRTQYLLGYYPEPRPAAGYRHVEVRINGAYTLRYRKGYFAGRSRQ